MPFLVAVEALNVLQPLFVLGLQFGLQIGCGFWVLLLVLLGLCRLSLFGRLILLAAPLWHASCVCIPSTTKLLTLQSCMR